MKSGALWVRCCRGLALADFGRDPHCSDSWRARRNCFCCQINSAIAYLATKNNFDWLSSCRYSVDRAQNLPRLAPDNNVLRVLQISSRLVHCNGRFHRFPVGQISRNLKTRCRSVSQWKLSEQNFENFTVMGRLKTQKNLKKFQRIATSDHHNSAMITDRRKFSTKITLHGISSFHFYIPGCPKTSPSKLCWTGSKFFGW